MSGQLSKEKREMIIKWKGEIGRGIREKETRFEELKREIKELKFKIDTVRPVKDLIKDAMTKEIILIRGVDSLCDPKTLDQCINKSEEEKHSWEKEIEGKETERRILSLNMIIDYQKLIVLEKDLEESD